MAVFSACALAQGAAVAQSFQDDLAFLKAHTDVIVLSDATGKAKVAVVPSMQGRVITSTAQGDSGTSFGWMNRDLIAARKLQPHINVFGGEDRFWMGPEGGQFSIFFAKGVPFDLEHWYTPAPLDTEPFEMVEQSRSRALFRKAMTLTNYSGTRFDVAVNRTVEVLKTQDVWERLGVTPAVGVDVVGFESINRIRNAGSLTWQKQTGLLSIWILGMFTPSLTTTIVVPVRPGPEETLGKVVTSDYFGPIAPERLAVKDNVIYFKGDGRSRGKIGVNPLRCQPILGSYDHALKILTLVQFTLPPGETNYVNSLWQIQNQPYGGDALNSYNDGPASPGAKPLGPFYEMESSSPAADLAPGATLDHVHRTIHLVGPEAELDRIARATLGVGLNTIVAALPRER